MLQPLLQQREVATTNSHSTGNGSEQITPTSAMATLRRIARLAGPLALQNVFGYALSVIAAVAVGRLNDPLVLSSVVLAGSFFNVTGLSLVVGLSAGCDTIAGECSAIGTGLL